jgi:hypothetical protein
MVGHIQDLYLTIVTHAHRYPVDPFPLRSTDFPVLGPMQKERAPSGQERNDIYIVDKVTSVRRISITAVVVCIIYYIVKDVTKFDRKRALPFARRDRSDRSGLETPPGQILPPYSRSTGLDGTDDREVAYLAPSWSASLFSFLRCRI